MADYTLGVKIEGDASDLQKAAQDGKKSIKQIGDQASQVEKTASGAAKRIAGSFKDAFSGITFGFMVGVGKKAFDTLVNAAADFKGELESASKAWQTFEKNAEMNGHTAEEIAKVKKELQDFATQTIYSASDMATTYAQLDAVGIKSADSLVRAFGGIAAAAENPAQAMKTLSQQGVQMAAKPKVAWQDFKLMLEQTPAGIAAVAKEMGMSTSEMVTKVQAGEIATNDFFAAIEKVGTSDAFMELATEYKTADQAMDGLQETITNKLMPSFELLQDKAIDCIEGIIEKVDSFDGEGLKAKIEGVMSAFESGGLGGALGAIGNLMTDLPPQVQKVGTAFGAMAAVNVTNGILSSDTWQNCVSGIGAVADKIGTLPAEVSKKIAEMDGPVKDVIDKAKGMAGEVKTAASGMWDAFANNTTIGQAVSKVGSALGTVGGAVTTVGGEMMNGLVTMMGMAMKALLPAALIGAALAGLGMLYEQFSGQINDLINLAMTKGPEVIKNLADGIVSRIPYLVSKGAFLVGKLLDVITANLPAIISGGAEIIVSLVQGVAKSAPTLMGKITQVIGTLITSLAQVMPQLLTAGMQILQAIAQGISENLPVLIDFAFQAIQMLITGFTENLPQILEIAVQIITMLVTGLTEHIPELINMAITLITKLANAFIENLPLFVEAAVQVITVLASALIENLPVLIDGAVRICEALLNVFLETDWLGLGKQLLDAIGQGIFGDDWADIKAALKAEIDHIKQSWEEFKENTRQKFEDIKNGVRDKIYDMANTVYNKIVYFVHTVKEKVEELKEGFKEKIENLKESIKEKFEAMKQGIEDKVDGVKQAVEDGLDAAVDYVKGLIDDAWNWGSDLVSNIADGIWSGIGWITDAVSSIADTISSFLHFSEPDVGPLANFHTYMPDMIKGLAQGMKDNLPTLRAGVELVADTVAGVIPGTGTAGRYGGQGDRVNNMGGVYITVNGAPGQSEEDIADVVMRRIMDLVIADS